MFTAMLDKFPSATHLRCFRHFRKNIADKLCELHVTDSAQEILLDIFEVCAEQHQLRLVDADDQKDYLAKVASLQRRWDSLELSNCRVPVTEAVEPKFYKWFLKYKSEDMCTTMIKCVREKGGLTNEEQFYTNTSESINEVLKDKVAFKKCKLNQFVDHMLEVVRRQEKEMKKAICRLGDWRMHPQYLHLEKPHDVWFSMSSDDRKVHT